MWGFKSEGELLIMKKTLRYFTDEAITMFKANPELFCNKMKEHPSDIDWIDDFYGAKASVPSKYEFDFEFKPYDKALPSEDLENALSMYELFEKHEIGPATVYNEKFLTGFIFTFGYEYFMNVIGVDKISHVFGTLFFDEGTRRASVRNTIGRLYRYVQITIDESLEDRYEITKFAFQHKNIFRIRYYTYFDGEKTHKAYFRAFWEWNKATNRSISLKTVNAVISHLSILSNISDTDLMDERVLIDYLKTYIQKIESGND